MATTTEPLVAPVRRRHRRIATILLAGGLAVAAGCTDDPSGTGPEDDTDPAFTGESTIDLDGTAPSPVEEPDLPGDAPTPGF